MAITTDDFNKIWASTSPLTPYEFSENNYKEGWNFIGSTPPSRQMWDFLQKNNDEKMQYLLTHFDNYLPLSGGTVTGSIHFNGANNRSFGFDLTNNNTNMNIGWNWENRDGAGFGLRSTDVIENTPGSFSIYARDGSNFTDLKGSPNGSLTWNGKEVERVNSGGTWYIRFESGVQILWGDITSSTSGTVVTLPVAFKSNSYEVTTSSNGANVATWVNSWTATSFKLFRSTEGMVCYIAIGRWK